MSGIKAVGNAMLTSLRGFQKQYSKEISYTQIATGILFIGMGLGIMIGAKVTTNDPSSTFVANALGTVVVLGGGIITYLAYRSLRELNKADEIRSKCTQTHDRLMQPVGGPQLVVDDTQA